MNTNCDGLFSFRTEKAGLKRVIVTDPVTRVFPYDRVSFIEIINVHAAD